MWFQKDLHLVLVVLGSVAVINCGDGNSPSAPTSTPGAAPPAPAQPVCRDYASQYSTVITDTPSGGSSTDSVTCRFSTSDSTRRCDSTYMYPNGSSYSWLLTDSYASVADFVDEAGYTGRMLATTSASRSEDSEGPFISATTNQYDAQRRLTQQVTTLNDVPHTTYWYAAWDSRGRPTSGTVNERDIGTSTVELSYDDGARTVRMSVPFASYPVARVTTYNDFNFPVLVSITQPSYTRTMNTTVQATGRVCK